MVPFREIDQTDTEIREHSCIAVLDVVLCAIERLKIKVTYSHPSFIKVAVLHWCCLMRGNKDQQADKEDHNG